MGIDHFGAPQHINTSLYALDIQLGVKFCTSMLLPTIDCYIYIYIYIYMNKIKKIK